MSRQIAAPVTLAVLGAGGRGAEAYGRWALEHADEARVVAVAEPDEGRRARFAQGHSLDGQNVFDDWRKLVGAGRLADAIVIATPDRLHVEPTIAALELGYEVLLEKPIAPTEHELDRLGEAAAHGRGSITVAHVLRYTPFFAKIRELLDDGRIGELVGITHHENIGYWHFAHSFVRGSWRQTDEASPMLLAKACHDLDLMSWFAGAACVSVASAGGLHHFRAENAPPGAPARCTDGCPVADGCAFYAPRFYVERLAGVTGMPLSAITTDPTLEGRLRALREGVYGRCVYRCDNDVADHQAVLLEFANGLTATLTVSAFTADNTRTVKLMGTRGEIRGRLDTGEVEMRRFLPSTEDRGTALHWERDRSGRAAMPGDQVQTWRIGAAPTAQLPREPYAGHGGGDQAMMAAFCRGVRRRRDGDAVPSLTSLVESLASHRIAFAAERARRERRVAFLDG